MTALAVIKSHRSASSWMSQESTGPPCMSWFKDRSHHDSENSRPSHPDSLFSPDRQWWLHDAPSQVRTVSRDLPISLTKLILYKLCPILWYSWYKRLKDVRFYWYNWWKQWQTRSCTTRHHHRSGWYKSLVVACAWTVDGGISKTGKTAPTKIKPRLPSTAKCLALFLDTKGGRGATKASIRHEGIVSQR